MGLGFADWLVLGGYFAVIMAVGLWFGRHERSTHDYFLGGKNQHWLVVGLSILATELSALTFVAVPGDSFGGDWHYLQLYVGAFIGRVLIVMLLLPAFYGGGVTTVYEYLGQRFGPWTRTTASLLFFASRIIGSSIRLLVASLAISVVFDWPLPWVIVGAAGVVIVYTTFGGIKAIIWTDAFQALVFLAGAMAAVIFLFVAIPGSWTQDLTGAYEQGKFHVFTWTSDTDRGWLFDLNDEKLFWVLLISTTLQNMAALGTDQDLTQRMLTCPDLKRGQRSLIFNAFAGFPVVCLFLLLGVLMFVYYQAFPDRLPPQDVLDHRDRIFPHFITTAVPIGYGLRGLLLAGVFAAAMSSLDSALGALSSTAVTDFYLPYSRRSVSDREALIAARVFVLFFGVILAAVALGFSTEDNLESLWAAFEWAGLIFGALLGVFLLGVLTDSRGGDRTNTIAMLSSVAILVGLKFYQSGSGDVIIAWPWWVVIGTVWTFALGAMSRTRRVPV